MVVGALFRAFKGLNPPGARTALGRLINERLLAPLYLALANAFLPTGKKSVQEFREVWNDGLPMDNRVSYDWTPIVFSEMWIPLDKTHAVMRALREHYRNHGVSTVGTWAIELYAAPRSDFWLSPAYEQDVIKFDALWFEKNPGDPARDFYPQFWKILMTFGCRFHWAKHLPVDPEYMRAQYARWDDFMKLRDELDPNQTFVTDYWRERMGIPPAPDHRPTVSGASSPGRASGSSASLGRSAPLAPNVDAL